LESVRYVIGHLLSEHSCDIVSSSDDTWPIASAHDGIVVAGMSTDRRERHPQAIGPHGHAIGHVGHDWAIVCRHTVGLMMQGCPRDSSTRSTVTLLMLWLALFASTSGFDARQADPFEPVAFMVGQWQSTIVGQPGNGTGRRQYTRVLNNRFIRIVNRSEYPASEKHPKGEIHEDEGFFSFDRARKRLVLRQFHVEGFVNQFVQDLDAPAGTLLFVSEALENVPAGYRAREIYIRKGPDTFDEIFELSAPGKPFETYSRQTFIRLR
jgi:hypothetical protein